jgi:hypothetical protein
MSENHNDKMIGEKMEQMMNEAMSESQPLSSPSQQPPQLQFQCQRCGPGVKLNVGEPPQILWNNPVASAIVIPHERMTECPFCHQLYAIVVIGVAEIQFGVEPVMIPGRIELARDIPRGKIV